MGGLIPSYSKAELRKYMDGRLERINDALLMELQAIGEKVVNHARDLKPPISFTDQTGNLRSSIGYGIYINGKPITKNFKDASGPKGNKGQGRRKGEKFANSIARKLPKGISLVVVAGMEYAYYVEANNRDVLTSAERLAKELVPEMLKQLKKDIQM